jgi:hypothetical protein
LPVSSVLPRPVLVYADDAVRALVQAGRLEEGYPEWRGAGLPVEAAAS